MHILEIPKINDDEMLKDELVQWLRFIKEPENEEVEKFMKENKYLKQARKELEHLSGDPDFKRLLESRAGFLRDVDAKMEMAEKRGIEKEKKQIVKKMKSKNMSIDEIMELTGLSKEEIEKI